MIPHIESGLHYGGHAGAKKIFCVQLIEGYKREVFRRTQPNSVQAPQRRQPGNAVGCEYCRRSFLELKQTVLAHAGYMLLVKTAIPNQRALDRNAGLLHCLAIPIQPLLFILQGEWAGDRRNPPGPIPIR